MHIYIYIYIYDIYIIYMKKIISNNYVEISDGNKQQKY